jgi:hypothetical protein
VILYVTKKSYTTSGDGNRALNLSLLASLLLLLLLLLLPAACLLLTAIVLLLLLLLLPLSSRARRECPISFISQLATLLYLYSSTARSIVTIKPDQTVKSRASFHDGHA